MCQIKFWNFVHLPQPEMWQSRQTFECIRSQIEVCCKQMVQGLPGQPVMTDASQA